MLKGSTEEGRETLFYSTIVVNNYIFGKSVLVKSQNIH